MAKKKTTTKKKRRVPSNLRPKSLKNLPPGLRAYWAKRGVK